MLYLLQLFIKFGLAIDSEAISEDFKRFDLLEDGILDFEEITFSQIREGALSQAQSLKFMVEVQGGEGPGVISKEDYVKYALRY
jgi:acyl CoA:acetate/3-ketoacid CoA transferase